MSSRAGVVQGTVAEGFGAVADAFASNFAERGEVGAACSVYLQGQPVVEIWGGLADAATGRPWLADTPVMVFSSTKGATAIMIHRLAERGDLDLDAPVASVWPEFAAEGKAEIPIRWVLSHRAGVAAIHGQVSMDDIVGWHGVVAAVAAQVPNWEPGTQHGYHARTFGWILGEVIRRVTGRMPGRFFADEIAGPLGLDFWIGLPEVIEQRVATTVPSDPPADPQVAELMARLLASGSLMGDVMSGPGNLFAYDTRWNTRPFRAAEMPSSNGIATASSLARMYAAVIGPVDGHEPLLRRETVAAACEVQSEGTDAVIMMPTRFGSGFARKPMLGQAMRRSAFGHPGAGGSVGFADPEVGMAFGYTPSKMTMGTSGDSRSDILVEAAYGCLEGVTGA